MRRHKQLIEIVWFAVLCGLLFGPCAHKAPAQDFDRLTIRPYFDYNDFNFKSGIVQWAQSDGWPTTDPETVGLRAPESGVSSYTMTFGAKLPDSKACIKVDETGQWYYEGCGGGDVPLLVSDVVLPDNATDNEACDLARSAIPVTGVDVFYLYLDCAVGDHAQWIFRVPPDFTTNPSFVVWSDRTGTSTDDFVVKLRCTQPDNSEDFVGIGWDDTYTSSHSNSVSGDLTLIEVSMTGADMESDDLCIVDFEADEAATNIYFASVR